MRRVRVLEIILISSFYFSEICGGHYKTEYLNPAAFSLKTVYLFGRQTDKERDRICSPSSLTHTHTHTQTAFILDGKAQILG